MSLLSIDLGATKLALSVFSEQGEMLSEIRMPLQKRKGKEVGFMIGEEIITVLHSEPITSIGICVPGIYHRHSGNVWAPNIPGWEDYPLLREVQDIAEGIPVKIESDRSCYILGETWQGATKGCTDAISLAFGTGIGAGILVDGKILRGAHDIAGAIGWMAVERPFRDEFIQCGCLEGMASGEGIPKYAQYLLDKDKNYQGALRKKGNIKAADIFKEYDAGDIIAKQVIASCIELWGMAVANLISLFNPEKIILTGGVFGPALRFTEDIRKEAAKWAQPISMKLVSIEPSQLKDKAGLYGAAYLALINQKSS
jgi:glucokinase